jgi:hypothetical protein
MNSYLGQEVVTTSRQSLMSVALQRTGCECDNNDGALEHALVTKTIILDQLVLLFAL